ncbi:PREDICTED: alpha-2-macroglobulin-like protein 1 [Rhagoletis zephyria]|uniref:alpha-2-macroglobulin-like protein 1 n=1 Tax=Rhagoletis zephyria TaxID=28612 RepID=UPI000811736A|nr:PREDICTED: alpha-2-macroglobulin-like protein 1 [Rhagoletis zephyria]
MRHRFTLLLLAILQTVLTSNANGFYTVIAPGTIHTNRKYNVAVALHQAAEPATIKLSLTGPQYNDTKNVKVQPHEVQQLVFDVPILRDGDFNITAEGVAGIIFKNSTKLNHNAFQTHIKIQTDKGKYKPGDLINFRVLFLDENLKPSTPSASSVMWFEDGKRNRIKEYKNFTVTKGVYSGKFQISEYPIMGRWRLAVENGGWRKSIVSFDVEKYVLPKYKVNVDATSQVSVKDGDMQVVVRANYTYGKPVNAKVTLIIGMDTFYYFNNNDKSRLAPTQIIKTADMVNGKAKFDLSVKQYKDNFLDFRTAPLDITATVEENFTGVKINGTTRATLHQDRYFISCTNYVVCNNFKAGEEFEMSFRILLIDGTTIQDTNTPVRIRFIEALDKHYYKEDALPEPKIDQRVLEYVSKLNVNSTAIFKVQLPDLEEFKGYAHYFKVQALFKDEVHNVTSSYQKRPPKVTEQKEIKEPEKPKTYFSAHLEYPKGRYAFNADEQIIVTINSSTPLSYFDYNIIGRGNILVSERVFVPNKARSYDLTLTPSFMWMPYARLYAYYIDEVGEFRYAETICQIKVEMPNKLEISAPAQVKPGEEVALRIKTTPHSFVGLLAVDQSVLLLGRNNDISQNDFSWRLSSYATYTPWQGGYSRYPGGHSGVVTLTNANYFYNYTAPHTSLVDNRFEDLQALRVPEGAVSLAAKPASASAVESPTANKEIAVRTDFSETWIFVDIEDTQTQEFTWTKKIPDTITSWVVSGFALHPEQGLGVTTHTTDIVTFQPFFISVRLPYSVKRGEVINVPALVFNYLNKDLDVEITLDNTDGEYEFTEISNEIISETKRSKVVRVPAQSTAGITFMLRPKIIGNLMLKYTAISLLAGDAVHKVLKVVPEGVTEYVNRAFLVNLRDAPEFRQSFDLLLPADIVTDSQHIEIGVIGDLLGPLLNNLDRLLRMPSGCAEQTMSTLMPNYLVLKYLKHINKLTSALEANILQHLETGYQRMLGFRLNDGSYTTFHDKEKRENGSVWLTAYVVRSLHQLQQFIKVDDALLDKSLQYLANRQVDNGSFVDVNNTIFGAERQQGIPLTAHVLLAFLENKQLSAKYQNNIDNAFKFILEHIEKSDSIYAKALTVYALQSAKHPATAKYLSLLKSSAKSADDRMWWSAVENRPRQWWRWTPNGDVEITSLVLLALLDQGADNVDDLLPIVKWLVAQRNSYGGFISTQDTVLGLQALIEFAERSKYEPGLMDIEVLANGGADRSENIKVTEDNGLLLQSVELPPKTLSLDFTAKGKGSVLVQIAYQYNIIEKDPKPSFNIQTLIKKNTPVLKLEMDVCVEYAGEGDASNMALLEVTLPSGYVADVETFEQLESVPRVRQVESQKDDTLIVIYFESLPKSELQCLPIEALRQYAVARQKPASIVLYDYYDTLRRATAYYEVASKMCDICENDEQCKKACQ